MALSDSFAGELKAKDIRVNAVLPTIIDTPVNRMDMPDADTSTWVKPASAVRWLLSCYPMMQLRSPERACASRSPDDVDGQAHNNARAPLQPTKIREDSRPHGHLP
jgi:NAD(P)-dependent dehydrogenase (short-subunit alcohol dehydrogenase family)